MNSKMYRISCRWFGLIAVMLMVLLPSMSFAQTKVVVIPLGGEDYTPDPFRPVAPIHPLDSDYTIGATTSVDKTTGLEWQKTDDNTTRTWIDAQNYCAFGIGSSGTLDGKNDWRLPSNLELQSIVDYDKPDAAPAAINAAAFPDTNAERYWTLSTVAAAGGAAWRVDFTSGTMSYDIATSSQLVRCVRGGQ